MGWIARVLLYVLILAGAVGQIREDRRRGVRIDWRKTLVTGGGAIAVALLAAGGLAGALVLDRPILGFSLFALLLGSGLTLLGVLVNRHWPVATGSVPTVPLGRKGTIRLCAFFVVIAAAFGCLAVLADRGYETAGEVAFLAVVFGGGAVVGRVGGR